jgi:hypothetical protein
MQQVLKQQVLLLHKQRWLLRLHPTFKAWRLMSSSLLLLLLLLLLLVPRG